MRIGTKRLLLEVPTKPIIIIIMLRVDNMDDILTYEMLLFSELGSNHFQARVYIVRPAKIL